MEQDIKYIVETVTLSCPNDFFRASSCDTKEEALADAKRFYENTKDDPHCSGVFRLKTVTTSTEMLYSKVPKKTGRKQQR